MTEAEWLGCTEPQRMLEFLRGKASDRKLRLFACSCCYRLDCLSQFDDDRLHAVKCAELYADGNASAEALALAMSRMWGHEPLSAAEAVESACDSAMAIPLGDVAQAADAVVQCLGETCHYFTASEREADQKTERSAQCDVLRDLFGNPFCPPEPVPPAVLAWNDEAIPRIAQGIYDGRAFDRLPILADALLDAGCDDEELLAHCRSEGPHVKGCWAVDLILGRQ
jgi:hypothetical protein